MRRWKARNRERLREYAARADRQKIAARSALNYLIRVGRLTRPTSCSRCGASPPPDHAGRSQVEAHHRDHSRPFEVEWVCPRCHVAVEGVAA
jgi:Bacillus phage endonuclease